jgi:hypothetical protein
MDAYNSVKNLLSRFAFICILLSLTLLAKGQNRIDFKGRILDSETKEPLSFVSIGIPHSGTGVISNEYGEFNYHVPENFESDKIQISLLGYQKVFVNVSEIKPGVLNTISLKPEIQLLNEVTVWVTPAVDVVSKAIKNIRKNYPRDRSLLYGYYRDYISPIDTAIYKNMTEAALVIEDKGINTNDFNRTKIKLEQLRYNPGFAIDSSLNQAYGSKNKYIPNTDVKASNEFSILRAHNPIRNHDQRTFSFVDIFDEDFAANHSFEYESITQVDSVKVYGIRFQKDVNFKDPPSEYLVNGLIYIDSESFAILKFTYTVACSTPTYTGKFFDLKLEYKKLDHKYYLNYLSLINYFEFNSNALSDQTSISTEPYFQFRELFVNKIVTNRYNSLRQKETINNSYSLLKNKVPVREGFWESYNYTSNLKLLE